MANNKSLVDVVSNEYFNAKMTLDGQDMVLDPKVPGTLTFSERVSVSSVPSGTISKDENGNVNLGSDQNEVDGTNNVVAGQHQTIDATNSFSIGNNHTMDGAIQSAIIGGQNNTNNKVGSVILGGYNITAYRDNTTYVPDLKVEGVQVFGVDNISKKVYGEFRRVFYEGTSLVIPHAVTVSQDQYREGYIKLTYKIAEDYEGSITSAKLMGTIDLTCDNKWHEVFCDLILSNTAIDITIEGVGILSYSAEVVESAHVDGE